MACISPIDESIDLARDGQQLRHGDERDWWVSHYKRAIEHHIVLPHPVVEMTTQRHHRKHIRQLHPKRCNVCRGILVNGNENGWICDGERLGASVGLTVRAAAISASGIGGVVRKGCPNAEYVFPVHYMTRRDENAATDVKRGPDAMVAAGSVLYLDVGDRGLV